MNKIMTGMALLVFLICPAIQAQVLMSNGRPYDNTVVGLGGQGFVPGWGNIQSFSDQKQTQRFETRNESLEKFVYVGGVVILAERFMHWLVGNRMEYKELPNGFLVVNKSSGKWEFIPYTTSTGVLITQAGYPASDQRISGPPVERWNGQGWDREVKNDDDWVFNKTQEYIRLGYIASLAVEMARRDLLNDLGKRESLRKENEVRRAGLFEAVPKTGLVSDTAGKLEKIEKELENLKNAVNALSERNEPRRGKIEEGFILDDLPGDPSPATGQNFDQPSNVRLASLTPEEKRFFNEEKKGLVVTQTFQPQSPRKVGKVVVLKGFVERDGKFYPFYETE